MVTRRLTQKVARATNVSEVLVEGDERHVMLIDHLTPLHEHQYANTFGNKTSDPCILQACEDASSLMQVALILETRIIMGVVCTWVMYSKQ